MVNEKKLPKQRYYINLASIIIMIVLLIKFIDYLIYYSYAPTYLYPSDRKMWSLLTIIFLVIGLGLAVSVYISNNSILRIIKFIFVSFCCLFALIFGLYFSALDQTLPLWTVLHILLSNLGIGSALFAFIY
ncbi:MAG: hypothetical protein EU551_02115 [Promethearchaeota archaeon]|nr:MAG: hypothetical protein EU551_02115 [Candidatus Lokiarchaeota archaeon]